MRTATNTQGKTRPIDDPYEVWTDGAFVWKVLRKYQAPQNEKNNPHARWFCAVQSPLLPEGDYEYGDTYVKDIKSTRAWRLDEQQ